MSISSKLAQPLFRLGCMSILVLVILVGFNFGEGVRAKDQQASSLVEVKAAIPKNFPPQYFLDKKGQPQGFAIDVLNQVAEKMGIRVVYQVEDDWNEVLEALRQDRVDLIPNLGVTPVRKADFAFTSTIETFPVSIFVRRSTFRIRQVKDLSGKSVAVVKKNAGVNLLQDKGIELEVVETP
ncbi:MAG: transporter substrate-binding domain-containing protein, partial [Prochloraceae cyanobacterium]